MANTQYICTEGDRWDNISQKAYGSPILAHVIIAANPKVFIEERLTAGTVLDIPIIAETETKTDLQLFPPWKRPE